MAHLYPRQTSVGQPFYKLTDKQYANVSTLWRSPNVKSLSKTALLLKAISDNPLSQTSVLRNMANCANVPDLVALMNKKLMNKGLMVVRMEPVGVARNADFHRWGLIKAPIAQLPVQMAVNDPVI